MQFSGTSIYWSFIFLFLFQFATAQNVSITGTVTNDTGEPLGFATVATMNAAFGTVTNEQGEYALTDLPAGALNVEVRVLGYRTQSIRLDLTSGQIAVQDFSLEKDVLRLDDIVLSATRNAVATHEAPVIVNRIDDRIFQQTQSLSLSEGLNFSPGLRLENNCQNCGFTQLRMNGLDGPYTQILINSRPVFSALAGVYGLEMIPANMVERVEVVRGGGSALYGANAIAGTVNIITKDPISNSFEVGTNLSLIDGDTPDRTINVNGSIVDKTLQKGLSFYAFNRSRDHWDANGDGFSEITLLENTTFGLDAFYNPDNRSKIKLNVFSISEFRRGGNRFDLPPHQTDVTEQLDHRILGGNISYERFSKDLRHKLSVYSSITHVDRQSYYGGGGRILGPGDQLTADDLLAINAYGESSDISLASGVQYAYEFSQAWLLTAGVEYQYNDVLDKMPGYNRQIDQQVSTLGTYGQLQWKPTQKWSFLLGARYDQTSINGLYQLDVEEFSNDRNFGVFVPRLTTMYAISSDLKFRMSYAQGYRGPQAFDEDLHIETVGGAALFTQLDPNLEIERSNSFNASLDYTYREGRFESNFVIDGFYTHLDNPFINANQTELPSGVAVITKRNGSGATVSGANVEANIAFSDQLIIQAGGTLQMAQYDEAEELWAPEAMSDANQDSVVQTTNLLRTPNAYGYITTTWTPTQALSLSASGVFTGAMDVPHVIDPDTEYTILERTPGFAELNIKATYEIPLDDAFHLDLSVGVQNILNSFQNDFDIGADRDAGYVYGPVRPRTFFVGMKFHFEKF
jgi:outer membrane receptor for ferrienterochelin and colicins